MRRPNAPRPLRAAVACLALAVQLAGCEPYLNRADRCLDDGASRRGWTVEFAGGGCVRVASDDAAVRFSDVALDLFE